MFVNDVIVKISPKIFDNSFFKNVSIIFLEQNGNHNNSRSVAEGAYVPAYARQTMSHHSQFEGGYLEIGQQPSKTQQYIQFQNKFKHHRFK